MTLQEQDDDDYASSPLSCMDNACEAMIKLFGAGSDSQDEAMETMTYRNMKYCHATLKAEDEEETAEFAKGQAAAAAEEEEEEQITSRQDPPAPATPVHRRTFSLIAKTKKNTATDNNKQGGKGVTMDDTQVEGRRKSRIGRWWKKKFHKEDSQHPRSKSVPRSSSSSRRSRNKNETIPPSPSTVDSRYMPDAADYIDMSHVYNEPRPTPTSPSAASLQPRSKHVELEDCSDDDDEHVNVWKELNDMWEESGHDLLRVVSDNLSVNDGGRPEEEEEDIMAKYEQAVAAEGLLEARRNDKSPPVEVTV